MRLHRPVAGTHKRSVKYIFRNVENLKLLEELTHHVERMEKH